MKIEWLKLNEKQTVVLANPNGQYAANNRRLRLAALWKAA